MFSTIIGIKRDYYLFLISLDWGNIATEIGGSEFVVRSGAEVEIDSVINTVEYVQQNSALS